MNQERIGNFIKEKRKEKNLTQEELASKLRVSNRTISKWENGHGMPDYSMISDLCSVLDTSINELLSGEKLKKENYQDMFEKNMLKTIEYNNKKRNRSAIRVTIIVIILLVLSVLLGYRALLINGYTSNRVDKNGSFTVEEEREIMDFLKKAEYNTEKIELNEKANTQVVDELSIYIPEGYELVTDIKVSSAVDPYCDLYMKAGTTDATSNSSISVCKAGNTLWDLDENISMYLDSFDTVELYEKYGFKSVFNLYNYYVKHKNDKLNYFSKLDDVRLMYALRLLFRGSLNMKTKYNLYTYDKVEGLSTTYISGNDVLVESTNTLLTPQEYRSYTISISSSNGELSDSDIKDILGSLESTL